MNFILRAFIIISLFSNCVSRRETSQGGNCCRKWAIRYNMQDSNATYHGFKAPANCFPFYELIRDSIIHAETVVYDRRGEIIFQSKELGKKWICNNDSNNNFNEDTYIYHEKVVLLRNGKIDTLSFSNTLIIYKK